MATEVERLSLLLEMQGTRFENQLKRQNAQAYRIFKQLEDRASAMESNVSGSFDRLARIIGGAAVINELKKLSDAWLEASNKIKSAGLAEAMAGSVTNEIADIATRARSGFSEVADLYARLTRTGKTFGATQGEIAVATETVSKALKVSGASASEVQSTLVQLGQALGSGRLQGDELRSLLENAPVVAGAIAKEFGVAVGALKDLGAEGKLTSERVFRAIVNAAPEVGEAFAKTNASIADSFTLLQNAALKFVGNSRQMGLAAQAASSSIQFLARNLDGVATAAAAVGAVIATRLVAAGLAPMVAQIGATVTASAAASAGIAALGVRATVAAASVTALRGALALVGGPVGAAIFGTAAVVAYLATESTKGSEATDRYGKALASLRAPADDAKNAIKGVGDQVAETSDRMNNAAKDTFSRQLKADKEAAEGLERALRSALTAAAGTISSAGVNAEDKKRAIDLVTKGLEGNEKAALAAADELRKLGETDVSFARAFGSIAVMLERLAGIRAAAIQTRAALEEVTVAQSVGADQRALRKSGFTVDLERLPDPAAQIARDPVVAGLKLQAKVREAEMDKGVKALKDKTREIWDAALASGSPVSMKQAETAAKAILAAEAAQKGGGAKGPKSVEDKAEDRLKSYTDSLARQNLVLQAEIENFGKSNAQKRAAMELARAGVDLNRLDAQTREEVLGKLNKEIALSEQLRTKKKELEDAQKAVNDASKFFGDAITDSLEDLIINGAKAEDVMKRLIASLAKAALQASLMGSGPLAGLFGTSGSNGAPGGFWGMLFGSGGSGLGLTPGSGGLYADGGYTGSGGKNEPAGMVHKGEYVFSKKAVQKLGLGNLEALHRGFASGGAVGMPSVPSGLSRGGGMKVVVQNTQSDKVEATPQMGPNGDLTLIISAVEAHIANNVLRGQGSLSPALTARQTNQHRRG